MVWFVVKFEFGLVKYNCIKFIIGLVAFGFFSFFSRFWFGMVELDLVWFGLVVHFC